MNQIKQNQIKKTIRKYYDSLPNDWKKAETEELLNFLKNNVKRISKEALYKEISENNFEYGILFNLGIGTDLISSKKAMIEINYEKAEFWS